MTLDCFDQGEDQGLAPVAEDRLVHDGGETFVDDPGGVLVHRRQEQRLLAREVGIGDGAAIDCPHRGAARRGDVDAVAH